MSEAFVDTDVIIRLLTGDDLTKQAAAATLFERVEAGEMTLQAPDTVIADAVFVLSSQRLYGLPRNEVRDLLVPLLRLPAFVTGNRRTLIDALDIYGSENVDFGDAMIVAALRQTQVASLYSYDRDFDRFPDVRRIEP